MSKNKKDQIILRIQDDETGYSYIRHNNKNKCYYLEIKDNTTQIFKDTATQILAMIPLTPEDVAYEFERCGKQFRFEQ